ncbi:hypothetical protein ACF0H5_014927 [Mactra antiquata]
MVYVLYLQYDTMRYTNNAHMQLFLYDTHEAEPVQPNIPELVEEPQPEPVVYKPAIPASTGLRPMDRQDSMAAELSDPEDEPPVQRQYATKEYKEGVASINLQHRYLESIRLLAGSSADGLSLLEVTVQRGDFRFTQGVDEDVMYIFAALRVDNGDRRSFCEFHSPELKKRFISYDVDDILQVPEISYSHHGPALTVDRTALSSPSSFSQCEKVHVLALNKNICQKRCYMLLKYLFKYSINKAKEGLSTYHCKRVFLCLCENALPEQWTTSNVLECLSWLLSDLEQYLKNGWLPQYFIPKMNLKSAFSQKTIDSIVQDK